MTDHSPKDPAASVASVRSAARSYIADLRQARLARLSGKQPQTSSDQPPQPPAPTKSVRTTPTKTTPLKAGKRGVRVGTAATPTRSPPKDSPSAQTPSDKHGQAAKDGAKVDVRETQRRGAAKARAAAREAQQKIREARLKQRAAAAKQKQTLEAARAQQAQKCIQAANTSPSTARRRWQPHRRSDASQTLASQPGSQRPNPPTQKSAAAMAPPLTALGGIGEAMSERLQQAGIEHLEDLLAISPEALRQRLGPVSALANVEGWQAEASEHLTP